MSDNEASWPDSWPNKTSDWDGQWNGQYGKYVRADQESYFVSDDYYNSEFFYWPDRMMFHSLSWNLPMTIEEVLESKWRPEAINGITLQQKI